MTGLATDEIVLDRLTAFARDGQPIRQFRSIVSAHQYRRLYRLVREYVAPGSAVLDWGTGNGHFSYFLQRSGYRTTGFSLTPCRSSDWFDDPDYRFVQGAEGDPVHLPFADASFDAVGSIGVLEHVRETGGTELESLAELRRVLRPGGHFICYHLPNQYSAIEALARAVPGQRRHRHRYRYRPRDVRALVREGGFELLATGRYAFLPRNSWQRAPAALRYSKLAAHAWDALDRGCAALAAPICQNHWFVARRPAE